MTASLAFRKNEQAILAGNPPAKYTDLLPYIPGDKILEIGSAEGVLALLLAKSGKQVTALEKSPERHASAANLFNEWSKTVEFAGDANFICGDITDRLAEWLFCGIDTLVAVRSIYYLGDELDRVFAEAAKHVPNVVLCGNGNRAGRWRSGNPDPPLLEWNRYAAREGMIEILERHGYRIVREGSVNKGDEVVVGRMG